MSNEKTPAYYKIGKDGEFSSIDSPEEFFARVNVEKHGSLTIEGEFAKYVSPEGVVQTKRLDEQTPGLSLRRFIEVLFPDLSFDATREAERMLMGDFFNELQIYFN